MERLTDRRNKAPGQYHVEWTPRAAQRYVFLPPHRRGPFDRLRAGLCPEPQNGFAEINRVVGARHASPLLAGYRRNRQFLFHL